MASWIGPTTTITASIAPRIALKRVNTLARTISAERAAGALAGVVDRAACDALLHLGRGEPGRRRRRRSGCASGTRLTGCERAVTGRQESDSTRTSAISPVASSSSTRYPPSSASRDASLVGTDRDQLVAGLELHRAARSVDVAAGPPDGEQVVAGLELELAPRPACGRRGTTPATPARARSPRRCRRARWRAPGASPRSPRPATPSAGPRRRALRPRRRGGAARAARDGSTCSAALRSTHTSRRSRISSRRSSRWLTSAARLWSLKSSAEYARPIATSDTFFISTSTSTARSRSVITAGIVVGARGAPLGRAGELAQLGDAFRRAAQDEHVVGQQHLVAVGVDHPLLAAPDGDDAHADLGGEPHVGERAVREQRLGPHPHAVRDLLGRGEVGDQRGGDARAGG